MVDYFYKLDLPKLPGSYSNFPNELTLPPNMSETDVLLRLADVYTTADKYGVGSLGDLVCVRLYNILDDKPYGRTWSTESIVELLNTIYTTTSVGASIREVLREHILSRDLQEFVNNEKVKSAMTQHPEFPIDMFTGFASDVSGAKLGCGDEVQYGAVLLRQTCDEGECGSCIWSPRVPHQFRGKVIRTFFPGAHGSVSNWGTSMTLSGHAGDSRSISPQRNDRWGQAGG